MLYTNDHYLIFFFFNDTATTEIYTLSLHDALPISRSRDSWKGGPSPTPPAAWTSRPAPRCGRWSSPGDRKSTRLNSSHSQISYAVFCLKKKKKTFTLVCVDTLNDRRTRSAPCHAVM